MTEFYFRSGNEENGDCVFHRYTISLVGVSAQLFFITDVRIIEATPYVLTSFVFYPLISFFVDDIVGVTVEK
jgi:hypothetical protein